MKLSAEVQAVFGALHRHTPSLLNVCPCLVIMAKENEGLLDELNAFALLSE
jgi:hypothetical protein